jgi:hypothetical protein
MDVSGQLHTQQFYSRGKSLRYPLPIGKWSREKSLAPVDNCTPVVPSIAIPNPLFRLLVAENYGCILRIKLKVCIVNSNFKVP